jgi:hypothetical protein
MKIRRTAALLITVLVIIAQASCGGGKKASTPTEAFKLFYEATKKKDVAALKSLISEKTLAAMETQAKSSNKALDDYLIQASGGVPPAMPQTGAEKINGDEATLEFKREGAATWSTASFVKEDGGWKINFK